MKSMRAVAIGLITVGALACATLIAAQEQTAPPQNPLARVQAVQTSRDSRQTGVNVVRLINTAEMNYKHAHGNFATWDELLRSGEISAFEERVRQFQGLKLSSGPEVVPGWLLNLVTAADGQGYELSLRNLPDKCGFSLFSDQRGIIYQGGWIDCSVELKPAGA